MKYQEMKERVCCKTKGMAKKKRDGQKEYICIRLMHLAGPTDLG